MTKKEIEQVKEALVALVGTPMRTFDRSGAMLFLNFGDYVDANGTVVRDASGAVMRDEAGNALYKKSRRGMYALSSLCSMRFTCGSDVIFAGSDIFLPTENLANDEGFNGSNFDWQTPGNTLFDDLLRKHFRGDFSEYVVKSVKVGRFGDLNIGFENDFVLEFFADGSGHSENWRFGMVNSTDSLIVTSKGIINESD